MKPEELLEVFSDIDPQYVEEAEDYSRTKRTINWKYYAAAAASVGVLITGGYVLSGQSTTDGGLSRENSKEETMDGMQQEDEAAEEIPDKIYIGKDCYSRTDSTETYDEDLLLSVGELGDETDQIHSEPDLAGLEVYRIDATRIMVEINGKYYTYKK